MHRPGKCRRSWNTATSPVTRCAGCLQRRARQASIFAAKRRQRFRRLRSWAALVAAVLLPLAFAAVFPETVVKAAPVTVRAYEALGRGVNIYGLDIRHIELQHLIDGGTRVLAVKGEIANISGSDRKIPWCASA